MMAEGTLFVGLWMPGTYSNYYVTERGIAAFVDEAKEKVKAGLRLSTLRARVVGSEARWTGIWRPNPKGGDFFDVDLSLQALVDLAETRHDKEGLRLRDFDVYSLGKQVLWAGLWETGTYGNWSVADKSLDTFVDLTNEWHNKLGRRLVRLRTYVVGGQRLWAGLYKSGTHSVRFHVDRTWGDFAELNEKHFAEDKRLVDVTTYLQDGKRLWAGVWHGGHDGAHWIHIAMDAEKLRARARGRHAESLRLVGLAAYPSGCDPVCQNQLVMPAVVTRTDGTTSTNDDGYNYEITRTPTHCPGPPNSCGTPAADEVVVYRWPVDRDGTARYARISAVEPVSPFLTMPFTDSDVERWGIWRYGNGDYHHAGDYVHKQWESYDMVASAPGEVIHVGWDSWSGNTVIVSHDVDGVEDAYRTIYMHLRSGPLDDCERAWSVSMPGVDATDAATYRALLEGTGCPEEETDRSPDAAYWGTDADKISVTVGQQVSRGQKLARAGCTGPGGQRVLRSDGLPNTHLHIKWARRDPSNDEWYLFDPYGLYAMPGAYPAAVTDPLDDHAWRYPVAWQGGHPQLP